MREGTFLDHDEEKVEIQERIEVPQRQVYL
jgi:hypothetical protein